MGDDSLICNVVYPVESAIHCRIVYGKRARSNSAGLRQLPTWKEENFEEATAMDGSD